MSDKKIKVDSVLQKSHKVGRALTLKVKILVMQSALVEKSVKIVVLSET